MADETPDAPALVPMRQQQVDFYGDQLPAGQLADGRVLVPLKPICDALGLDWSAQTRRARRDPVLAEALQWVAIMTTHRGRQRFLSLPLDLLPGWLFGIAGARVKPDLQEKILRYRRECFRVLWDAFKADILPVNPQPATSNLSGAELALEIAEAVAALARQHIDLERRHTTMADYMRGFVQQTAGTLADYGDRLQAIELRLGGGTTISEAEAAEIALAVKNVAKLLEGRGISNPYQQVWGDLYRRFRVAAYRNLPAARYQEVLDWLGGWYGELSREGQGDASDQ